jgi:O-antigen ligase
MSSDRNVKTEPNEWEKIYINQLSYSINWFLVTGTGALGFCISQIISKADDRVAFQIAAVCLFLSICAGVFCTIIRLWLFMIRKMGLVANWDEKKFEKLVFRSFVMQIALFMLGIIIVGVRIVF